MASSGSAYGRFRRALDIRNLLAARATAIELKHVGLVEALELTLLILAKEPTRFRAAALRWHARYRADTRASIEEATAVLGLLAMLKSRPAHSPLRELGLGRRLVHIAALRAMPVEPARIRAAARILERRDFYLLVKSHPHAAAAVELGLLTDASAGVIATSSVDLPRWRARLPH